MMLPELASAARPAFQVNDTNDRVDANLGDGLCRTSAGTCTLRAAIQQANMLSGADAIDLPGGVYTIRLGGGAVVDPPDPPGGSVGFVWDPALFQDYEGDFDIGGPLTINGAGDASTIVDGGSPAFGSNPEQIALDRIFEIHPNAGNVTISGLTIREGWAEDTGGGVMNHSTGVVRLVDSTVRDNLAWNYGGGVHSGGPEDGICLNTCPIGDGRMEIVRTNFTGNRTEGKGGGIFSTMSSLAVIGSAAKKSTFTGNHADEGAAIYNGGELSPTGSRARIEVSHGAFEDNLVLADGGALYNEHEGDLAVSDSSFTNNLAWGEGGAVDSGSKTSASIARSTFTGNRAGGEGGAVKTHPERPVSITDSTFTDNHAGVDLIDEEGEFHEGEGGGGGVFADGTGGLVMLRSTFEGNSSEGEGGGLAVTANGTVLVSDSEFYDNHTETSGGGILNAGMRVTFRRLTVDGNKAFEEGGGIDNQGSGEFVVEDSTISRNTAYDGGGISNRPDALSRIVNSTLWDNRAKNAGGGFNHESDADTDIFNTTLSGNVAQFSGGGIYVDADGGLRVVNSTITQNISPGGSGVGKPIESINFPIEPSLAAIFRNTIVAGNRLSPDCNGAWGSEGGNLDGGDDCYFQGPRDRTSVDPELDAIADNGGHTMTHAPRPGSFAIDGGVDAVFRLDDGSPDRCPDTDQRGIARPQNGRCDIGAQEFDGPFPPPDTVPPQTTIADDNPTQTGELAKFRFSGTDNVTPANELSFECRILNQDPTEPPEPVDPTEPPDPLDPELRWYGCNSPWPGDALQLEDGPNRLEVRAVDRAGNVDPTPDAHMFIGGQDVTPPQTFLTARPTDPSTRNTAVFGFSATDDSTDPSLIEYECRIDFGDWEAVECLNPMSFSNLSIGQHTFHVRAIDEGDNIDPTPATYTWTVAPPTDCDGANITLGASADSYVDEGSPIENFGISEELIVRAQSIGPPIEGDRARALVNFVLPNAIPGCQLTSARLRLFSESEPGRQLQAVRVAQAWSEMQVTWNNQPATTGTPAVTDSGNGYREWNVTSQIEAMMAGGGGHGFLIRDVVENAFEGAEQSFSARNTIAEPPQVPKLVLRYSGGTPTPPPPPPSEDLVPTHVECGQVLTQSTLVTNDLSCEFGDALTIGAPNVVLDLGGHTIDGPDYLLLGEEDGLAAGIRNIGHENVVIRNGTVQEFGAGVALMAGARWGRVEGLTLHRNALGGVELFDADDGRNGNVIRDNTFTLNEVGVSVLAGTENAVIEDNLFDGNVGVAVYMIDSSDNRIEGNEVSGVPIDPNFDSDGGLLLEGSTDNVMVGNRLTESGDGGVILAMGSHRNRVESNILSRNGDAGIAVEDSDANELIDNTAHLSSDAGIVLNFANDGVVLDNDVRFNPTGVDLAGSSGNVVEGNDADGNDGTGIAVGSGSLRNRIVGNEASNTRSDGIAVEGDALDPVTGTPRDGNLVEGNATSNNRSDGIVVGAGHTVSGNSAHNNLGWGINGEVATSSQAGTVDGGGNTASGNGEPQQCTGVVCTPGTAPPLADGPDLTAPDTQVTHAPEDGASSMSPQVIRFTGTDNVAPATALRFECRLDPPPDPVIPPEPPEPPEPGEPPEPPEPVGEHWEECASPIRMQFMLTGEHRFEVRAIDPFDNVDFTPAVHEWTVSAAPPGPDSTAPQTTIADGPPNPSTSTSATFRFRASDNSTPGPDLTYQCRLDDAAYQPCSNPTTYENLELGEHTFRVRAVDVQGNADLSPASQTWTIQPEPPDNNPPETTIDTGPDPRTVQTGATLEFSSDEEGSTFECSLDGAAFAACTSPRELTGLAVGDHTFRVRATDRAGNEDATPASLAWTVAPAPVARTVSCGQTITQSTLIQNDLANCGGDGLVVGAHGITIDLDGRTIDGNGGGAGIRNSGFDQVTITGDGKLQEFDYGVQLNAGTAQNIVSGVTVELNQEAGIQLANADDGLNGNTVRRSLVTSNSLTGISLVGGTQNAVLLDNTVGANPAAGVHIAGSHGNRLEGNRITASSEAGVLLEGAGQNKILDNVLTGNSGEPVAVTLASNNNRVEGNEIKANSKGVVFLQSNGNQLVDNLVEETGDQGIALEQSSDSLVRGNVVRRNSGGIDVYQSSRNRLEENEVSENSGSGIWIGDLSYHNVVAGNQANANDSSGIMVEVEAPSGSGTLVDRNTANGNDSSGISVLKIGHTVVGNRTDNNQGWGIYGSEATSLGMVVDGGGNRAVGNKELLQCYTIRCDGSPPVRETFPPETTIDEGPADQSLVDSASFSFSGSDNSLIAVRFECRLDGGAYQACASPQGHSGLAEGDHVFEVRSVDHAGNVDHTPARWEWTYEPLPPSVAPDTTIDSGPDPVTVSTSATFGFSSNEPGVTFTCSLDGAAFTDCDPPQAYTGLSVGEHTFSVRARDGEGNVDGSPATQAWRIGPQPQPEAVSCGEVITTSVLVTNSLTDCPADGLVVGAHEITIDLNGNLIDGVGAGAGVRNPRFDSVTITNGTVQEFEVGVQVDPSARNVVSDINAQLNGLAGIQLSGAADASVRTNTLTAGQRDGIALLGGTQRTLVRDNSVTANLGRGIWVENSSDNRIERNSVGASADVGISLEGSRNNRLVRNDLSANAGGIEVQLLSHGSLLERNTLSAGEGGINVGDSNGAQLLDNVVQQTTAAGITLVASNAAVVRRNDLRFNDGGIELSDSSGARIESNNASATTGTGIAIDGASLNNLVTRNAAGSNGGAGIEVVATAPPGQGALLDRNTAMSNGDDGILVEGSGHTIVANVAHLNGEWGIYSNGGNVDGGGNLAAGNVEPAQCFGVVCSDGGFVPPGLPDTTILEKPTDPTASRRASFTFIGEDDTTLLENLDFQCRLDSSDENDWVDCENPQEYASLAPGGHTFEVRAVDESGFFDPTPARYSWTYEQLPPGIAPDTQIILGPPPATPLFEAIFQFQSNEPDVRFECQVDDGPWQACADDPEMVAAGFFAHVLEFEETEVGPHSFRVRAIDIEGNVDPTPAVHGWTITGLLTTILSGPAFEPGEGGDPPSGGETESRTATFDFAANVAEATFECSLDLGPFVPCEAPVTYTGLAVGDHIFRIVATDPEGEMVEVEPVEYEWTVIPGTDDSPPETTIVSGPADGSSDTTFEFAGQDDQTGPNQLTFECRLDSTSDLDWYECLSPHNLLEQFPAGEFAPGPHVFEVRAIDDPETPSPTNPEGNPDPTPARYAWTSVADTTPPETTLLAAPPTPTLEPDIEIEFAGSDNATPLEEVTFECSLDGGPWEPCDSPHSVQGAEPGEHTVRVRAVDLALNVDATPASFTWELIGPPETTIDSAPDAVTGSPLATFEFSSDQPGSTFECSLNGAAMEPCSSPITYDVGGGGGYSFEVQATNSHGLVDETPALHEWTVDAGPDVTPPDTTILAGPPLITTSIDASFTFFASQFGSTFECRLDGEGFGDCTSPHPLTGLAAGVHAFEVRAVDPAGNVDPTPAVYTWTIDGPPVVEILTGPEEEIETTSATFTFESGDEDSSFECWLDGVIEPCESPKTWSGLSLGEHIFAVRATDPAGHVGEWEDWEFEVMLGAPPQTSLTAGPASETTSRSATFAFASNEENSTFECSLDEAAFATCESAVELNGLAFGDHTFAVRAIDAAGNVDPTPADFAWTILDASSLDTTISFGPPAEGIETEAAFAFSANAGDATFECSLDGAAFSACTSPAEYSDLLPGEHIFEVRARDAAGNAESTPAQREWTIVGPPVTSFQSAPAALTGETDARFGFAADQAGSTYMCSLDGAEPTPCTSPVEFIDIGGGAHTFEVEATNSFGLVEEDPAVHQWTIDAGLETTPPHTTITVAPPVRTGSTDAVLEFTGTDNVTGALELDFECSLNGGAFEGCSSPHELQDLEPGEYTMAVRAVDQAGNVDPTPATHSWTVDDVTAPETSIDSGPVDPTQDTSATFEFSSDEADVTFECSLDGAAFAACQSPHQVSGLGLGDHRLHVRARDAAGNADGTPDSWLWTVEEPPDTTPPVTEILFGPAATTIETTASFSLSADEAVDGFECSLDGAPFTGCDSPHELTGLSLGEHTLLVRAIDLADNLDSTPAEYTWTIVAPPPPPETSLDSAPPSPQADSSATFTFSSGTAGASFECSLDGSDWQLCASPYFVGGLSEGPHRFEVRARRSFGVVDPTPAAHEWTVGLAPDTQLTATPPSPTVETSATFEFTGSDDRTPLLDIDYECSLDGATYQSCSSPHEVQGLSAGVHTFSVRAKDWTNTVDPTPAEYEWEIQPADTTAPNTTLGSGLPPSSTTGRSAGFTFSSNEAGSTYECSLDNAAFAACTSPQAYTSLSVGSHTFRVRAIDAAGNVDTTPATHSWTILSDTTAPNTTLASGGPPFSFTSSESNSTFECSLDGSPWTSCTSPHALSGLPAGSHTFRVRARDLAGNVDGTPASRTWTVQAPDTTPPQTTFGTGAPASPTTSTSASFSFTSSESGSTFECSLDGAAFEGCTSPRSYSGLSVASHEFRVRARDAAGNVDATPATHTWTIAPPGSCIASTVTVGSVADGWILQDSANQNYGTDSVLKVDSKSGANARALVRFNLPAVPSGCQVTSAKLRLYATSYKTGRTLQALMVAAPWTEGGLNWNNQPATTGTPATVASGSGYREWTVTEQVLNMYAMANNGFLVRDASENATGIDQAFHSREKGTDNPPRLVITFG
jgi:CSLREA domain-containing protein